MKETVEASLTPYVARFFWTFVALQAVVLALTRLAHLPRSPVVMIGMVIGAALVAAQKFIADHKRPFSDGEKLRMTAWSLLVVLAVYSLRLLAGFAHLADRIGGQGAAGSIRDALAGIDLKVLFTLVSGTAIIAFISLFFAYAFLTGLLYRGMAKRGEL